MEKKEYICKFEEKVVDHIQRYLIARNFNVPNHKNFDINLTNYITYINKTFFFNKKWTVIEHPNLQIPNNLEKGFNLLKSHLETGSDINIHLSTKYTEEYNDMLLNDWGIHHFHLGETVSDNGFIKRTKELAFIKFYADKAYIIAIQSHGNWANKKFIEEIDKFWPEIIEHSYCEDAIDITHNPTSEEQQKFRECGLNSAIKLENGKIYLPIIGYNINGSGIYVTFSMQSIYRNFEQLYSLILQNNWQDKIDLLNVKRIHIQHNKAFGEIVRDIEWELPIENKIQISLS